MRSNPASQARTPYLGVQVGLLDPSFEGAAGCVADLVGTSVPAVLALIWSLESDPQDPPSAESSPQALDGVVTAVTAHLQVPAAGQESARQCPRYPATRRFGSYYVRWGLAGGFAADQEHAWLYGPPGRPSKHGR